MPNTSVAFEECTVIISREAFTVFVLVTESGDRRPIAPNAVVGLRVQRATGFVIRIDHRISSAKIENCLSGHAETVSAFDCDGIAQEIDADKRSAIKRLARGRRIIEERAELRKCKLNRVMPPVGCLLLQGGADVKILIALCGIVRNSVERDRVGRSQIRRRITGGYAKSRSRRDLP